MMNLQAKLVVAFVWCIIVFETTCYLYLYSPLLYLQNVLLFLLILPVFITIVSILCISYYKSIYCSPGYPSRHINLHYHDELEQIKQSTLKLNQMRRLWRNNPATRQIRIEQINSLKTISYCKTCELVKEQRVHHCSICKICIQRMDHHCPWVGNCVGKLNHKYFILFLFYATTGLLIVAISFTIDWLNGQFYASQLSHIQYLTFYFSCITSYMLALSIGFLFVTQMLTACRNITTLESFTEGIYEKNPFQGLSCLENLRQIFGSSTWFLPTDPFPTDSPLTNGTIDVL